MFTCGAKVRGERQFKTFAVVAVVVIDEAVCHVGGGGGDAADAAANSHLAGAANVGAGTAITDSSVLVVTIEVEVSEGTVVIQSNDSAFIAAASRNSGVDDHTVPEAAVTDAERGQLLAADEGIVADGGDVVADSDAGEVVAPRGIGTPDVVNCDVVIIVHVTAAADGQRGVLAVLLAERPRGSCSSC